MILLFVRNAQETLILTAMVETNGLHWLDIDVTAINQQHFLNALILNHA